MSEKNFDIILTILFLLPVLSRLLLSFLVADILSPL